MRRLSPVIILTFLALLGLAACARGVPDGQASPAYSGFINRVEEIAAVTPLDRIGVRLLEEGFSGPADFADAR